MKFDKDSVMMLHEYSVDVANRLIYLGSCNDHEGSEMGVDYKMAEKAIKNLYMLDGIGEGPITVVLNSPGGDTCHGFAIYDAIKGCQNFVNVLGIGYVMSMGSIIMQAGDERLMTPNAKMMIHYGSLSMEGSIKDVISWVDAEKKEMKMVEDIYLDKIRQKLPKFSRAALQSKIRQDCILSAEDALALGLINRIQGGE